MTELTITKNEVAAEFTEDLFARFVAYIDAKPRTIETYARALKQFISWLAFNGIKQPTRADIINYREYLKEGHKATTVQNYIIALRQFFQWTEQEQLYPDIAKNVKGATISKEHKKDYLTAAQVKAILGDIDRASVQGKRDYAMFALMVTGGLRDIEVSRANVEDLRTAGDNTVLYLQGKGRDEKADFVIIPTETEKAIRDYLKSRGTAGDGEPLFTSMSNNSKGSRMTTRSISGTVKSILVNAGYDSDRLTAHSLRHTAVTLSLIGGSSLEEAQQFARHTNIATTQIYAHNLDRMSNKCSRTIAGAIF